MAVCEKSKGGTAAKMCGLPPDEIIFGRSAAMASIRQMVQKVLGTDVSILIQGANGTGKGLLAQYIHARSSFSSGAFVKVNCAAIPGALLESELFGYEKGAFTDAHASKPGYVEMADRGTLFLDEIAELSLNLQAKILQLLQDGQFSRIGDKQERRAEIRVICATNRNLQSEIDGGRFRRDLFYRINVININLPELRERREDIVLLADYFLGQLNARFGRETPPFTLELKKNLVSREWRGNIRELENWISRYVLLGEEVLLEELISMKNPSSRRPDELPEGSIPLKRIARQAGRAMSRELILQALQANHWNRRRAARDLKISYRTLLYEIREIGLPSKRLQKQASKPIREANPPAPSAD
jgi:two-component system response regulator AtoC